MLRTCLPGFLALASFLCAPAWAGDTSDGTPPIQWVGGGQYDMSSIDITPDGQTLVTSSFTDETIKVWNLADGSFVRTLAAHIGGVQDLALSPDGSRLISGGEVNFGGQVSSVLMWDVATGEVLMQLPESFSEVFCVDWSPAGDLLAAGDQNQAVRILSATDGHLVKTLQAPGFGGTFDVAFSPDGTRLLAGYGDDLVRIWNVSTGAVEHTLSGHTFFVDSVAWSPDGARVASGSWDDTIRTWTASTGALEHVLTGHTDIVRDLVFSSDGARLASGSWDQSVRLWNAASGAPVASFTHASTGMVNALRYTPDGTRLVTGAIATPGTVLDAVSGLPLLHVGHHHAAIDSLAVSADVTRVVSGSDDTDCRVWNAATGQDLLTFTGHDDVINALDLSPDATLAVSGSGSPPPDTVDFSARLWSPVTGEQLHVLFGHPGGTTGVALAPDLQTVVTAGRDGLIKLWSTGSGELLETLDPGTGDIEDLDLSPDGSQVVIAAIVAKVVRLSDGAVVQSFAVPGGTAVSTVRWSPNGHRVLVGLNTYGDNLLLFDADTGALLRTFTGDPDGYVQGVAFSPDGHTATCGSGYSRTIRTFSVDNGTPLKLWTKETGWGPFVQLPLVYAADGRFVYGRTDATVVMTATQGAIASYGAGSAGSGGFVPALSVTGNATAGGSLTVKVQQALGGAQAFMLPGAGQGSAPFKGGTLLAAPLVGPIVPLPLGGSGPGNGSVSVQALLPTSVGSIVFTLQAWVHDLGAPAGWASTNGVQVGLE